MVQREPVPPLQGHLQQVQHEVPDDVGVAEDQRHAVLFVGALGSGPPEDLVSGCFQAVFVFVDLEHLPRTGVLFVVICFITTII